MMHHIEKPKQIDLFGDKEAPQEEEYLPTTEEERWRLKEMYESKVREAPLRRAEAARKKGKKKEAVEGIIKRGRKKIGIHRKGDQEEINI